jgi:hypothetical protein
MYGAIRQGEKGRIKAQGKATRDFIRNFKKIIIQHVLSLLYTDWNLQMTQSFPLNTVLRKLARKLSIYLA